jgi:hypothetical protein
MMLGSVFRVALGYVAACLAAGLTQTLFVVTPVELASDLDRIGGTGILTAMTATQTAVFALPFAGIGILLTEWFAARGWLTHALLGIAIAVTGYVAALGGEAGSTATDLLRDYAFQAFLAAGAAGGLVYWLMAGRRAGTWHRNRRRQASER